MRVNEVSGASKFSFQTCDREKSIKWKANISSGIIVTDAEPANKVVVLLCNYTGAAICISLKVRAIENKSSTRIDSASLINYN